MIEEAEIVGEEPGQGVRGDEQAVTLHFKAGVSKRVWVLMGWVVNEGPSWAEVKRTWLGR